MNERAEAAENDRRIGVFTTDTDLVIKSWDSVLEQMTGIAPHDACGRTIGELVPDLGDRVPAGLFREPLISGSVQILAPALHKYLIPCPPAVPSSEFDRMQQRVVVGALRDDSGAVGLVVTVEDVTARLESERRMARTLREGTAAERLAAITGLVGMEPTDGLGPLETALHDEHWEVRRAAVRAVAARRDAALVDTIIGALRDGHRNFSLLSSALELLSTTGVDVTDALVSLMGHADPDLRIQAALALGTQHRSEAIDALIAALDDPDVNVRFHAIEALGKRATATAIERLGDIAASGDFFLAFPAIEALVQIGDPLGASRLSALLGDEMLASAAADALGRLGDEDAVQPLVHALDDPHGSLESIVGALVRIHHRYLSLFAGADEIEEIVRRTVSEVGRQRIVEALPTASREPLKQLVTVLGWIPNPSVPAALARLLGSSDVRHEVVEALVRCGGSALDLLISQLRTDDTDAKRAAIIALGRVGDTRATPALVELLGQHDERGLWVPITGALARLGDRRPFETLLQRLGDPDVAVRQGAIGALNSMGHPEMSDRIVSMLDDPNPFTRESAVRIAGYFGYSNCVDRVFGLCRDEDEAVRAAAVEHLPYFDDRPALDTIAAALSTDTPRVRAAAANALGAIMEAPASRLLAQALDDADSWVRYFAAMGLGRHGDASALPALGERASGDPAMHVSVAAIDAVAAIGTDDAFSTLSAIAAQDGERGIAAVRALGRLPAGRVVAELRLALRSADPHRRAAAVEALLAHGSVEAIEALSWTATADADVSVARAATNALGAIANRSTPASAHAVRALIESLRESACRADALDALAHLAPAALPELTAALGADDPVVRRGVVEALSRLSHPVASACLRRALTDGDAVVRRTAVAALSRVGSRGLGRQFAALAQSDPSPAVRHAAANALHRGTVAADGDE